LPRSSVLKTHGGKVYLADWIISYMPKHIHFVETHFGGGAVLLAKDPDGISEVANDICTPLMHFWSVLQSDRSFAELKRRLEANPFSEKRWNEVKHEPWPDDPIEQAVWYFILVRQSRQGLQKDFATVVRTRTRRRMNDNVSAWLSAIESLPEVHARIRRVLLLNQDSRTVLKSQDGKQTLFYCDPTYLPETRVTTKDYTHEMTPEQHVELLQDLAGIQGKFLLSGYRSKLYDDFAKQQKWRREEKLIPNQASGKREKELKTECLWMNY
jgi:DNA adenine methylase